MSDLPPEAVSRVGITTGGLSLDGLSVRKETLRQSVRELLDESPQVVVSVEAKAEVTYREFVEVLGEVLAAGATRVAIEISPGLES